MFIGAWGLDGYGTWVVLTAVSVSIAVSTTGLSSASTAEMLQAAGSGDEARARHPVIPVMGVNGIPLRDEIELEMWLKPPLAGAAKS